MDAWSTAPPDTFAGQPDLFALPQARRPVVRCWLAFDRYGHDYDVACTLAGRRHLIVDALTGRNIVGDDDLIMMPNWSRDEFVCLGPSWLSRMLPDAFRRRGLAIWSTSTQHIALTMFRPHPEASSCLAFETRPGPSTGWFLLRSSIERLAEGIPEPSTNAREGVRTFGTLDGLLQFEIARSLTQGGGETEATLEKAKSLFRRAAHRLAIAGSHAWSEAAERNVTALSGELFRLRQPNIPNLLSQHEDSSRLSLHHLGVGVHSLLAMPLPPLRLDVPQPSAWADTGRRDLLCVIPFQHRALRQLLPSPGPESLTGQVVFEETDAPRAQDGAAIAMRLGIGRSVRVSASLDGEVHQLLRVASRGRTSEPMVVFADGNGVAVTPSYRRGKIGHPLTFKLTGRENGQHSVRFTFLTRDRVVSKIQRTIEVFEERRRDGAIKRGPQQAG